MLILIEQGSCRAYGTAFSGVVIHLDIGLDLDLTSPNVIPTLIPTLIISGEEGGGYIAQCHSDLIPTLL